MGIKRLLEGMNCCEDHCISVQLCIDKLDDVTQRERALRTYDTMGPYGCSDQMME
jgi:hypothetical protein